MAERMREVIGKHSTSYVCDEHGWDFIQMESPDEDYCPVCKGEALAEDRIIKLLQAEFDRVYDWKDYPASNVCLTIIAKITKGENK